MDLSDLIARNADFTPDKVALRFDGRSRSYAAFAGRIVGAARALKSELGIARGDRVAILAANHPDYLVLLYACARLGALLVPLKSQLGIARGDRVAILAANHPDYLVLLYACARLVALLVPLKSQLGIARGDRVAILAANH